jgi:hypothetical protein
MPTSRQRKFNAQFLEQHEQNLRSFLAGWANVFSSSIARGVVTAMNWLRTPMYPQASFAKVREAEAWVAERLREARAKR